MLFIVRQFTLACLCFRSFPINRSRVHLHRAPTFLMMSASSKRKRDDAEQGRSAVVSSYGILLYKRDNEATAVKFLLGLIPQRNWWTVFKGLPNDKDEELPVETAIREFEEETGSTGLLDPQTFQPFATLHGRVGNKKRLEIFLHDGSFFDETKHFCLERVVKIDSGYMEGKPEIVAVRWCTLNEALTGVDGAKIYKSQRGILLEAHNILVRQFAKGEEAGLNKKEEEKMNEEAKEASSSAEKDG